MPDRLILASASPRRRDLLASLGLAFRVRAVEIDETPRPDETPRELVERLAHEKARARVESGELVVAGDTIVVLDDTILGKPSGRAEARRMLSALSGREHLVLTGVAVANGDARALATHVESTLVRMAPLSAERIRWYVDTGEPMDKAGAYAIQGLGAACIEAIEGSYTNVVGLPLAALRRLMAELGYELFDFRAADERPHQAPDGGQPTADR